MRPRRSIPSPRPEHWEPAKLAVQEVGGWIKNADSKVTVLAAGLGVTLAAVAAQAGAIAKGVGHAPACTSLIIVTLAMLFAVSILSSAIYICLALYPRDGGVTIDNRFSWTTLSKWAAVPDEVVASNGIEDAWRQAQELARIAKLKFRAFRTALLLFGLAAVFAFACIGISNWVNA